MRHNRQTVAKLIAGRTKLKEEAIRRVLDCLIEITRERLLKGEEVAFRGLGRLYMKKGKVKFKSYIRSHEGT